MNTLLVCLLLTKVLANWYFVFGWKVATAIAFVLFWVLPRRALGIIYPLWFMFVLFLIFIKYC